MFLLMVSRVSPPSRPSRDAVRFAQPGRCGPSRAGREPFAARGGGEIGSLRRVAGETTRMTTIRFAFYDPFAEVMYRFPTFQQAEEIAIKMGGTRVVELEDDQVIRRWRLENGSWQAINIRPRGQR